MGFKLGVVVGLGIGYYLGTKASPASAAQVDRFADTAVDKAKAVVELGIERARDAMNAN